MKCLFPPHMATPPRCLGTPHLCTFALLLLHHLPGELLVAFQEPSLLWRAFITSSSLLQWFPNGDNLLPPPCLETFLVIPLAGVEARDAAKHPSMHGTASVMPRNYLATNVYGVGKNPPLWARYPLPPPRVLTPACLCFHHRPGQLTMRHCVLPLD